MKYTLLIIFAFTSLQSFGQGRKGHDDRGERMESYKIAYLTQKLSLTSAEAQSFWPVYNEQNESKKEMRRKKEARFSNIEELSDEQAEAYLKEHIKLKEEEVKLKEMYLEKFLEVLPAKKVLMYYHYESKFKSHLLDDMKKRMGDRHDENRQR